MGLISKLPISGCVNGLPGTVVADAFPGNTIHESTVNAGVLDEVWVYLSNIGDGAVIVNIQFDDGFVPTGKLLVVPAHQEILAVPGLVFNSINITIYVATADIDKITYSGFVNRIDQS